MKPKFVQVSIVLLALVSGVAAQEPRNTAKNEAAIETQIQRAKGEQTARLQLANESGTKTAKQSRERDREFMSVWSRIAPNSRNMPNARELAERLSKRPEWRNQTRAERVAAITAFITNYPAIKATLQQKELNVALASAGADYPKLTAIAKLPVKPTLELEAFPETKVSAVLLAQAIQVPPIAAIKPLKVPDLFTINQRFNWSKPHGQWMNQLLKDIDAAKASGDIETYNALTARYSTWAEKYLRR